MEHDIFDDQKAGIENLPNSQAQGICGTSENLVESHETIIVLREDENSKSKSDTLGTSKVNVESKEPENHDTIIDIRSSDETMSGEFVDPEKVCRICHLNSEHQSRNSNLIYLGCGCKNELGISHPQCAEAWFRRKGNRQCEICGKTAQNVTDIEDSGFNRAGFDEMRLMASARSSLDGEEVTCWRRYHLSDILFACMILAFVLPWFVFESN